MTLSAADARDLARDLAAQFATRADEADRRGKLPAADVRALCNSIAAEPEIGSLSRRQFFAHAAAIPLVAAARPRAASAANETRPEFDAAAYFGIFSCEGWGQKRMPGSNTCVPK